MAPRFIDRVAANLKRNPASHRRLTRSAGERPSGLERPTAGGIGSRRPRPQIFVFDQEICGKRALGASSATKYYCGHFRRRKEMQYHLFQRKSQWAATDDISGQKLPSPHQWTYRKTVTESRIGFDAAAAEADIRRQGFHLFIVSLHLTETEVTR
jgi:hypothetical protein